MPTAPASTSPRPNILLVVLDSLRADRLSCYGGPAGLTPNLDALAAGGVRFTTAISESTWTLPMAHTLLTGLTPREHRAERHRRAPEGLPTLPVLLRAAGYDTFCSTANTFVHRHFRLDRGFDAFRFPTEQRRLTRWVMRNLGQPLGWTDHGGQTVVGHFRRWLRRAEQPWFATLWINDAHYPYVGPLWSPQRGRVRALPSRRRFGLSYHMRRPTAWTLTATAQDYADLSAAYDGGVTYVDALVGRVAEELSRGSLEKETTMFVLADHGDMLGEHGLLGHGTLAGLYQPLVHVPLIVRGPGWAPAVSGALVQASDVTQTVADLAGVGGRLAPTAAERLNLRTAAGGSGRATAFSEHEAPSGRRLQRERARTPGFDFTPHLCPTTAVFNDGFKLINRTGGQSELYDLGADPHEQHDLMAERPERAQFLRSHLEDYCRRATPHAATSGLSRDDSRIVDQRLRDLGYL